MFPYNGFVGFCLPSHVHATEGFEGPVPTVRSETWRAAVDDRRYLRLLEEEIERHDPGEPAVREAKAFLDALRVDFDAQPYRTFRGHWRAEDDEPRDIDQNLIRWLLAAHVLRLQGRETATAVPVVRPMDPVVESATTAPAAFAASEFKLKFGQYYRQGELATITSLQLFPPDDETARQVASQGISVEIADADGKILLRQQVPHIRLYRPNEARLSLADLAPGSYCAHGGWQEGTHLRLPHCASPVIAAWANDSGDCPSWTVPSALFGHQLLEQPLGQWGGARRWFLLEHLIELHNGFPGSTEVRQYLGVTAACSPMRWLQRQ